MTSWTTPLWRHRLITWSMTGRAALCRGALICFTAPLHPPCCTTPSSWRHRRRSTVGRPAPAHSAVCILLLPVVMLGNCINRLWGISSRYAFVALCLSVCLSACYTDGNDTSCCVALAVVTQLTSDKYRSATPSECEGQRTPIWASSALKSALFWATHEIQTKHARVIFSMQFESLRDDNVITSNLYKNWSVLHCRIFWIFLPNVVKIEPFRFKVGTFLDNIA